MIESNAEGYVRTLLRDKFGAVLRKIPDAVAVGVKTPDFELLDGDRRVAVIEVKNCEFVERIEKNGWRDEVIEIPDRAPGLVFKSRDDNGPDRVGALIYSAYKQLRNYDVPKVLAFVNDEHVLDVVDLQEAWNGFLDYGTEETGYMRNHASRRIASGRIKPVKAPIDLYIWFDRHYGPSKHVTSFPAGESPLHEVRTEGPQFRCTTLAGYELARHYFGCPEMEVPDDLAIRS